MANKVLYSATVPIRSADPKMTPPPTGSVPYFVSCAAATYEPTHTHTLTSDTLLRVPFVRDSGPFSRDFKMLGGVGTLLHVGVWLGAVAIDIAYVTTIDQDTAPAAFQYWLAGFVTMCVGLVVLVLATLWHMMYTIPEGGAPPFLMTLFIAGAKVSLLCTVVLVIASIDSPGGDFFDYKSGNHTTGEMSNWREQQRGFLLTSMALKVYIYTFLECNQNWAGPANALRSM